MSKNETVNEIVVFDTETKEVIAWLAHGEETIVRKDVEVVAIDNTKKNIIVTEAKKEDGEPTLIFSGINE